MRATRSSMLGFCSMIATVGLFIAANGFAADSHMTSKFESIKANTGTAATRGLGRPSLDARSRDMADDLTYENDQSNGWEMESEDEIGRLEPNGRITTLAETKTAGRCLSPATARSIVSA